MSQVEITNLTDAAVDAGWATTMLTGVIDREARDVRLHAVLVDDEEIRRLHREFHDDDTPTDVISFPLEEADDPSVNWDPESEGPGAEIVVSVDTARREAARRGIPFENELALYLIHGTLHILGYDDIDDADRARMRAAEARHLEAAGLPSDLFESAADGGAGDE